MALKQETFIEQTANPDVHLAPERTTVTELQERLTRFVGNKLEDPRMQEAVLGVLQAGQQEALQLTDPRTGEKRAMDVSILPVVISEATEQHLEQAVQVGNLVRAAVLMRMNEDDHLRSFFESGVDPLAVEIMRANPYRPAKNQWRFRADTITNQAKETVHVIENNGGEPQGDAAVGDNIRVVEKALGVILGLSESEEIRLSEYPEEQMMEVLIGRYQEVVGTSDLPTIGYFAWKGGSTISDAEAKYTAKRYKNLYGKDSVQFDPTNIVDIQKRMSAANRPYYVVVCETPEPDGKGTVRTEVDMVRRLHGEPMENMELWRKFKNTYGQNMCSDGEETVWERFTTRMGDQMINPLNSWATDKKLDVILGNPEYLRHFGIWDKVVQIVADDIVSAKLSLTNETRAMVRDGRVLQFMAGTFPMTYMLRRKKDGLHYGDTTGEKVCLTNHQIARIKTDRNKWVLKRDSLVGHSGTSVHVGKSLLLEELDFEDYMDLSEKDIQELSGMTKKDFVEQWLHGGGSRRNEEPDAGKKTIIATIAKVTEQLPEKQLKTLRDHAWEVLIENSLDRQNCLVQQAVEPSDAPAIIYHNIDGKMVPVTSTLHYDLDPQSIGAGVYTHHMLRLSSRNKTNVSGGYGGLGAGISESMARSILDTVDQQPRSKRRLLPGFGIWSR